MVIDDEELADSEFKMSDDEEISRPRRKARPAICDSD